MAAAKTTYFRKGLGLKAEVKPVLDSEYNSDLVAAIKASGHELKVGRLTLRMAHSLGFCYGVDRAVEYAYETCIKFPDHRVFLIGEIIHNPHVNNRLKEMGVTFLYPDDEGEFDFSGVTPDDVVVIPAFGVKLSDFEKLRDIGCVLVDTTCGSVLHVWKRVEGYARDGFTAIVHGKYYHEETRATSSQVMRHPGGTYLVVRDMNETKMVCDFIRGTIDSETLLAAFTGKCSEGFDPDVHLQRIGVANQTTMLASDSLEIAAVIAEAILDRHGDEELPRRFRSFDTICSATQDRQDAVVELMHEPPDLMIVVGGYNSSNTTHLAHLCAESARTFHIETDRSVDPEAGTISHRRVSDGEIAIEANWIPSGEVSIGLTAGASTPDSLIGRTVNRILLTEGLDPAEVLAGLLIEQSQD
jgi:4-hydroxy-3-methylbut-2-enyl diphosphate reductase